MKLVGKRRVCARELQRITGGTGQAEGTTLQRHNITLDEHF
jgi:hypothetical protein